MIYFKAGEAISIGAPFVAPVMSFARVSGRTARQQSLRSKLGCSAQSSGPTAYAKGALLRALQKS